MFVVLLQLDTSDVSFFFVSSAALYEEVITARGRVADENSASQGFNDADPFALPPILAY